MNQSTDLPTSLTVGVTMEEAVARLVNLDYVPAGFTVLDMTSAFAEEAAVNYENAKISGTSGVGLASLKAVMEVCKSRNELAIMLMDSLSLELRKNSDSPLLDRVSEPRINPILSLPSVNEWAEDTFGISLSMSRSENGPSAIYGPDTDGDNTPLLVNAFSWEDVTIKIYKDYIIGWRFKDGKWRRSSYRDIGLIGARKINPNALGILLLGLAQGKKYPVVRKAQAKDKTSLSKLRKALCTLTGLGGDPFLPFTDDAGWKPRFTVIDDRRNADERAKAKAVMVALEPEAPDYEREEDDADKWLREQQGDNR